MQGVRTGHDARFDIPPEEVPWGSIALALFLTMFGAACFGLAWMHLTQQIFGKEQAEMAFSLVGLLTFIPGVWMGGWVGGCGQAAAGVHLCAQMCTDCTAVRVLWCACAGAYHTWIAICVWRGVPGYHW